MVIKMELDKFLEINSLLSVYKSVLSEKQKEYLEDYFENDFSLSEIAKNNSISRQAVYDNINKSVKILNDLEKKLGFMKRNEELRVSLLELKKDFKEEKLDDILNNFF